MGTGRFPPKEHGRPSIHLLFLQSLLQSLLCPCKLKGSNPTLQAPVACLLRAVGCPLQWHMLLLQRVLRLTPHASHSPHNTVRTMWVGVLLLALLPLQHGANMVQGMPLQLGTEAELDRTTRGAMFDARTRVFDRGLLIQACPALP